MQLSSQVSPKTISKIPQLNVIPFQPALPPSFSPPPPGRILQTNWWFSPIHLARIRWSVDGPTHIDQTWFGDTGKLRVPTWVPTHRCPTQPVAAPDPLVLHIWLPGPSIGSMTCQLVQERWAIYRWWSMANSPISGKIYIYSIYISLIMIYTFLCIYVSIYTYIYISLDWITELMAFG